MAPDIRRQDAGTYLTLLSLAAMPGSEGLEERKGIKNMFSKKCPEIENS